MENRNVIINNPRILNGKVYLYGVFFNYPLLNPKRIYVGDIILYGDNC